jgi:hypothetical protein
MTNRLLWATAFAVSLWLPVTALVTLLALRLVAALPEED